MKERIQKVLGNAGVDSRRKIEEMVIQGRITVNGKIMRTLPVLVDPEKDKITVDDEPIRLKRTPRGGGSNNTGGGPRAAAVGPSRSPVENRIYYVLNKPRGVYSTNVAQGAQIRAIDLLPPDVPGRLYPVGRLGAEARGLLLLTNDGELTNRLTHPSFGVPKVYRAIIDGAISPANIEELERGVWMADPRTGKGIKTSKCKIEVVKRLHERTVLDITLSEGRHVELRRLLAHVGHKVRELTRIQFGPLALDNLKPGHFRELTPREVKALRKSVDRESHPHGKFSEKRSERASAATAPLSPAPVVDDAVDDDGDPDRDDE